MKTLDAASRERDERSGPEHAEPAEGVSEQVFHLVEEEERTPVPGNQALRQPEFLEPLLARRLVSVIVGFADAVEGHAEPCGERLAELRLAGAGRTVEEDVDARRAVVERAPQQLLDVVAVGGDMAEIRPFEFGRRRDIEKQTGDVDVPVAGCRGEAAEPALHLQVAVVVDGHEPGADQRRTGVQTGLNRPDLQTENQGHCPAVLIECEHGPAGRIEDVVDHGLEQRVGFVAQQQFEDVDIRSSEARPPSRDAAGAGRCGPVSPECPRIPRAGTPRCSAASSRKLSPS